MSAKEKPKEKQGGLERRAFAWVTMEEIDAAGEAAKETKNEWLTLTIEKLKEKAPKDVQQVLQAAFERIRRDKVGDSKV